jgi:transcriptional regulator with PAS, ATPase and Fis domain
VRNKEPYREFSILELSESLIESELFGHVKGAFTGASSDKKGLFELADRGILFLDEIGDYDQKIQAKVLRFLDDKTVTPVGSGNTKQLDVQLILASNQEISALIREKKFREDLYQRINKVRIELPPLRERREDIEMLATYFFNHFRDAEKTKLISVDPEVYEIFNKYSWPGNIRELQSVIWDACTKARLHGDTRMKVSHLKKELTENILRLNTTHSDDYSLSYKEKRVMVELEAIDMALDKCVGRKNVASEKLRITPDQMRYKVLKYNRLYPSLIQRYQNIVNYYNL